MLTPKQRAYLRGQANQLGGKYQLGKNPLGPTQIALLDAALRAKELIKISLLKSVTEPIDEIATNLEPALRAEVVATIGRVIILFRPKKKESAFTLPNG